MKKICFLFAFLIVISAIPSYATKIIINNENDRIVYSRSSYDDNATYDEETKNIIKTSYFRREGLNLEYDRYLLELLGRDFRKELAGTKWHYDEETIEIPVITKSKHQLNIEKAKRNSREASDYYMVDLTKNPNKLVPSGYSE